MAPRNADQYAAPLRMINNRLSSTPLWQLPQVVPYLADTIGKCSSVFSDADAYGMKDGSDVGMHVHRIKTRISTLLQDKSPQARWAAVVFVKAIIEAGGIEVLHESNAWIRLMIGSLGRPDPPSLKKLCMITLTRCFLLAQGHQSVMRELATPVLPAFLTACLKILRGGSNADESLLLVTLQTLNELLPFHPASFRPFQAQIRSYILPMLAQTPSSLQESQIDPDSGHSPPWTNIVADSARQTYVLLSVCAPKKSEGDSWSKSVRLLCDSIHFTADDVFRAVIEDRDSTRTRRTLQTTAETVSSDKDDPTELPHWTGIQGGIERLIGLMRTLQAFIATSIDFTVTIPVGLLLDVFDRILLITSPITGAQVNAEIGRDEREGLAYALPIIHATAVDLVSSLLKRLGQGAASFYQETMEQCLWILKIERSSVELRIATYRIVCHAVLRFGLSFPDSSRALLAECLTICCEDIYPSEKDVGSSSSTLASVQTSTSNGNNGMNPESYVKPASKRPQLPQSPTHVQAAATELLLAALKCLPEGFLSPVRADVDRIAVLAEDENLLLASVLYPPPAAQSHGTSTSLMPFLSRACPGSSPVEALMRPRMPVIQSKQDSLGQSYVRDEEMEEPRVDHLYSGTGHGDLEMAERASTIEDSVQTGKENAGGLTAITSYEALGPVYTHPQSANLSMVEVPETQPATLAIDETQGNRDVGVDSIGAQRSSFKHQQDEPSAQTEYDAKRPRLAETVIEGPETRSHITAPAEEAQVLPIEASPVTSTRTAPAIPPDLTIEEPPETDSDYSSVHLDPTLSTDEEEDDDEDDI